MSISAAAPIFYGALPVFADIEEKYFCLDPDDVERKITKNTKAIIVVDIFGQSYEYKRINEIARKHSIMVIEDAAQVPFGKIDDKFAGNNGDMGIFSLNYHKHIHTGEGGVIVTNDDDLAMRCKLIRNHAEAVVDDMGYTGSPINMVGMNLRMTEVEAAIGRQQLKKLQDLVRVRRENVARLEALIRPIEFLIPPAVRENAEHVYYVHAIKYEENKTKGVSRKTFVDAVNAELTAGGKLLANNSLLSCGYVKPLYLQSLYQKRTGIGSARYPFENPASRKINYERGLCPNAERFHFKELIIHDLVHASLTPADVDDIGKAFQKVAENLHELT